MQKHPYKSLIVVGLLFVLVSCNNKIKNPIDSTKKPISDSLRIDSVTQLIRKNPRNHELYSNRADIYLEIGNLARAINDLTIANRLDSLNPIYYIKLSDFYLQLGKSETINSLLLKGNTLIPNNKEIVYRLGNLYFYIQDYKKAISYLNQATEIDPFYAPAFFTKGLVFIEIGNIPKAITSFQIAVEREPDYYDAYMQLGLLFAAKNDSIAVAYYNNALRIMPNSYEALYAKAMFYQQTKKLEQAIATYQYLLHEVSNQFPFVHFNLGYIEMTYYGEYERAIAYYDSALMSKPVFPDALCNRAFCFEKMGKKEEAHTDYLKALDQSPNYPLAIKGLNRLDGK